MATKPTFKPEWALNDITLPVAGTDNKIRPTVDLRNNGIDYGQQLTAQEFNWILENIKEWIDYFEQIGGIQDAVIASGNEDAATANVGITAYNSEDVYWVQWPGDPGDSNTTTTPTIALDGLAATTVTTLGGAALAVGDLESGKIYPLWYDGSNFRVAVDVSVVQASAVTYDNTASSLSANNVKAAIDEIDNNITSRVIDTNTTLAVPGTYSSISLAMDYLQDKEILEGVTVTIQVADGTYSLTGLTNLNHPNGSRIELIGNTTTPANCVLEFTTGGLMVSDNHSFGKIDGFTIQSTEWTSHGVWSDTSGYSGIAAIRGGIVEDVGANMVLTKNYYNLRAADNGAIYCSPGVTCSEGGDGNVFAFGNSVIHFRNCTATLAGDSANGLGFGVISENNSWVLCSNSTASNNDESGFYANSSSSMWADNCTADSNGRHGFESNRTSSMQAIDTTSTNNTGNAALVAHNAHILFRNATMSGNGTNSAISETGGVSEI